MHISVKAGLDPYLVTLKVFLPGFNIPDSFHSLHLVLSPGLYLLVSIMMIILKLYIFFYRKTRESRKEGILSESLSMGQGLLLYTNVH